jgi:hypothetical protein
LARFKYVISENRTGFEKVKFPIRLGEYKQLNDGLLGYWLEGDNGSIKDIFYAPQSDLEGINHPAIKFHNGNNPWHIDLNLKDPATLLTMLIRSQRKTFTQLQEFCRRNRLIFPINVDKR